MCKYVLYNGQALDMISKLASEYYIQLCVGFSTADLLDDYPAQG